MADIMKDERCLEFHSGIYTIVGDLNTDTHRHAHTIYVTLDFIHIQWIYFLFCFSL